MRNVLSIFIGICIGLPLSLYAHPIPYPVEISKTEVQPLYGTATASETICEWPNRLDTFEIDAIQEDSDEQIECEELDGELELLACLVYAEAGIEDMTGKRLVADVVLNRVDSKSFPDSITNVIYERNQFSCVYDGNLQRAFSEVTPECYEAVRLEMEERTDNDILFFTAEGYNPSCKPGYQWGRHYFGY